MNKVAAAKIQWAKEKADWLDPFISKKDQLLDYYSKDEIIQPECLKNNTWENKRYSCSSNHFFWSSPYIVNGVIVNLIPKAKICSIYNRICCLRSGVNKGIPINPFNMEDFA